jgi:hypothetical protein
MTTQDNRQPFIHPLDAQIAEMRARGVTEDVISKFILDKLKESDARSQPQPQAGAAGFNSGVGVQGVMTGALNNFTVALTYAQGFLPSVAADITNLFGGQKSLDVRSRAGVFLLAKVAFVGVLGFAIYQEFLTHIIYGTEAARNEAIIKRQDAAGKNFAIDMRTGEILDDGLGHRIPQPNVNGFKPPKCTFSDKTCLDQWVEYYQMIHKSGFYLPDSVPWGSIAQQNDPNDPETRRWILPDGTSRRALR